MLPEGALVSAVVPEARNGLGDRAYRPDGGREGEAGTHLLAVASGGPAYVVPSGINGGVLVI